MIHFVLHLLIPAFVVLLFFRSRWKTAYFIMIATMVIDADHLLATPVYDPNRCSIGFHPLHQVAPIAAYVALCFVPKFRILGIGLVIHILLDFLDCQFISGI